MQIDVQTVNIEQKNQTFTHLKNRFGDKKIPSRYQEASYDLQAVENLHYRPTWAPEQELYDPNLSKIRMNDWYDLKDPRQFYYSTYTLNRAKQQETMESNFKTVESLNLIEGMPDPVLAIAQNLLIPLRHANYAANMNNTLVCGYGYGTVFTQPCVYHAMDNLGIAQYLSRLGLMIGDVEALEAAKQDWMDSDAWQPLRRSLEDLMCERDPVEVFIKQNFVLDGLLYPLVYQRIVDQNLVEQGGSGISILTQFMTNWYLESKRWVDSVLKTMASESAENKAVLEEWVDSAANHFTSVLLPVAGLAVEGNQADKLVSEAHDELLQRAKKAGLFK